MFNQLKSYLRPPNELIAPVRFKQGMSWFAAQSLNICWPKKGGTNWNQSFHLQPTLEQIIRNTSASQLRNSACPMQQHTLYTLGVLDVKGSGVSFFPPEQSFAPLNPLLLEFLPRLLLILCEYTQHRSLLCGFWEATASTVCLTQWTSGLIQHSSPYVSKSLWILHSCMFSANVTPPIS